MAIRKHFLHKKSTHSLVAGLGSENEYVSAVSSKEWNTSVNLTNRKVIFSKYVCFLALLNVIHNLKSSGSSPTGDWVKAINHSCTFLFFLCISVALFLPSSSSLTCSHSPRVYQQGTKESKNHPRGLTGFTGSACVLILPFTPASKWFHSQETPEFALPVGFRKSKHTGFIVQSIFFKIIGPVGEGDTLVFRGQKVIWSKQACY